MEQMFKQIEQKILSLKQELGVPIDFQRDTKHSGYEEMISNNTKLSEYAKTILNRMNIFL